MDQAVIAPLGALPGVPDVGGGGGAHVVLAQVADLHPQVFLPAAIAQKLVGHVHPAVDLHPHAGQLLLQLQIGKGVHGGIELPHDAHPQGVLGLVQGDGLEGALGGAVARLHVGAALGCVHGGEEVLVGPLVLAAGGIKAAVLVIFSGDLVYVFRHPQALHELDQEAGVIHFGIEAAHNADIFLLFGHVVLRQVDEVKLIAQIPENLLQQLPVIAQPAQPMGHQQGVRPRLQGLDHAAQHGFKGGAHEVWAVFGAQLHGALGEGRGHDVFAAQGLLHNVFESAVILRVPGEGDVSRFYLCHYSLPS